MRVLARLILFAVFVAGAGLWAPPVSAQATGTLRGTVLDPAGDAVPGAVVTLAHRLSGFEVVAESGADGRFELTNLAFRGYEISVASDGFQSLRRAVDVRSNIPVESEFVLSIETQLASLEVNINDRAPLVDREATGTKTELSRAAIEMMPIPAGARGLEQVLLSFPGFAANANGAIHPRGAHNQMTFVVDGMPISDQFTGSFATSIDPSLVNTIELFTGDIPVEYGSKLSGVANITTRSGFDSGGRRFGSVELAGGGFDMGSTAVQAGGAEGKFGYFASVSAVKSNRFLDAVSLDNLHNGGHAERAFARLDYQASDRDVLRVNLMAGRSSFQLANLRSQHANGQQQRRLLTDGAISLGYVRTLSPSATFDSTSSYRTVSAQLFPSAGDTPVTASLARHLRTAATFNRLNWIRGRHTFRVGFDFQRFPVTENFFFGLTDPDFNAPDSEEFNPNLAAHDLTRGGDWFRFSGGDAGRLTTVFLQDRIRYGPWLFSLGARYDAYNFLVKGNQLQPRVGLAYALDATGTVFRISYNRNYQTPPNENLLLSNSAPASRLAPPEVRRDLNGGVILIRPQRQNVYEAGIQQAIGDWASLNAVFYHKDSQDLQDNDNFLNTGIIFPTSLASSNVNGFETRLVIPEKHGVSGSFSATHYRVVVTPPFTGGVFLGRDALDLLSEGPFIIDHDQPLALHATSQYRVNRNFWTSWSVRYDSGLVSNPSDPVEVAADPDFADQLPFVDLERKTPRVRPRTLVDMAVGYEHYRGDRRAWELQVQVSNLFNKTALYNFQSVFVGTRVVAPRAATVKWRWYF